MAATLLLFYLTGKFQVIISRGQSSHEMLKITKSSPSRDPLLNIEPEPLRAPIAHLESEDDFTPRAFDLDDKLLFSLEIFEKGLDVSLFF